MRAVGVAVTHVVMGVDPHESHVGELALAGPYPRHHRVRDRVIATQRDEQPAVGGSRNRLANARLAGSAIGLVDVSEIHGAKLGYVSSAARRVGGIAQ